MKISDSLNESGIIFPNIQQQGFQKGLGCLTASFNLHETLFHNLDLGSNIFISFLDTSKAFDTVWRQGLMYKLHSLRIRGKLWQIIDDCHTNTSSAVIVNQTKSRWFNVEQGVRQGGVLSTFLYLVFINDLLIDLENCNVTASGCILDAKYHSPALADDISCIATSPKAMQVMMNTAYTYSCKWRFKFNADKSCILTVVAKGNKQPTEKTIHLGNSPIPFGKTYNHLGIALNNKAKLGDRIATACNKGWKSFYGLSDISITNVNPITMSHLYKTVVRPSVLYGCELWNAITQEEVRRLNTLQHGVCKVILNLPKQTRSDMCEQLLNLTPIMAEIDARKLLFFGRLCLMDPRCLTKQIFILRLFSYLSNLTPTQQGFIPDILSILQKYNFTHHFCDWLHSGSFPSKHSWKTIVRSTVNSLFYQQRYARTSTDPDFRIFNLVFQCSNPHTIWSYADDTNEILRLKFTCKLLVSTADSCVLQMCSLCGSYFTNLFSHAACSCYGLSDFHNDWWNDVSNNFDINLGAELCSLTENELFIVLLGRHTQTVLSVSQEKNFRKRNCRLLVQCCGRYKRLCDK